MGATAIIYESQNRGRVDRHILLIIGLLVWPWAATAEQGVTQGVPLRNQNPFLQIFGLPPFQSAKPAADGETKYDISFDLVNHADNGDNALEDLVLDGESYFLTLSLRRGVTERLELGIDVPLVGHAGGFLDNAIENWHDLLGLSNSKRRVPSNQLGFRYSGVGNNRYELNSSTFGIGDIQLSAAMPIRRPNESSSLSVAVRSSVKLPTGDADELRGSGATDFSLGLHASGEHVLWKRDLDISGFAGVLFLGDGDVLTDIQRNTIPYGGVAAAWWITERFGITSQLYAQGEYFDSDLDELGGSTLQLAVGFDYRLPLRGVSLLFSIVEDAAPNSTTTPDVGVHFSIRRTGSK